MVGNFLPIRDITPLFTCNIYFNLTTLKLGCVLISALAFFLRFRLYSFLPFKLVLANIGFGSVWLNISAFLDTGIRLTSIQFLTS